MGHNIQQEIIIEIQSKRKVNTRRFTTTN